MIRLREPAPAKLNLALHVRGRLADGRHRLETLFAFCTDGDWLSGEVSDELTLTLAGPFGDDLDGGEENLVMKAARALRQRSGVAAGATLELEKRLPVASGIGGGSADAAAALRLLTSLWRIDPGHAATVAPDLGSDVPACLLSLTARGEGAGDQLVVIDEPTISGTPVLLVNPRVALTTGQVFAGWDGVDRGRLENWRAGRNDLQAAAIVQVPQIAAVLDWLERRDGAEFVRMSGSGATCFALFADDARRDAAAATVPPEWWHLATWLR